MTARAGGRKTRLDGIIADQVFVFRLVAGGEIGRVSANIRLPSLIDLAADLVAKVLVDNCDCALEGCIDRPVVRKAEWR